MEDIISLILILGIAGIVILFGFYIFKTYVIPKKVEELSEMLKEGQLGPAIKKLQKMLEENDRDPYIHFLLAEAYNMQKNYQQALLEYKQVLKIGKFDSKVREEVVRSRLAKLYMQNRNLEEAKKEYLILTKLDPTNGDNFYQVGLLFENAGFGDKALPYYKSAVKVSRNHAEAFYHIGILEYNINNIQEAKVALTEAVKLNPQLYGAHYYLGLCLKNQKDYEWALKEFDVALKDDTLKSRAYLARGLCFLEKEQYQQAMAEFEKGLAITPKSSEMELHLRYNISICAERRRDFHTAIANWERIYDVNPKYKDVADKLKTYEEFRTDDAIKDFMIASPGKFEQISRKIIESMELSILDLQVVNDSEVHILATETEGNWRNSKRSNRLIYLFRTTDPIPEKALRQMHEEMRSKGATRGMAMTTSEFSQQAQLFCQSRPIELKDKKEFIAYLRAI